MFRTYLLTAFRSLSRHRGYAFLNIAGLSLGVTCCMLLFLVIKHELSFDTFHKNRDRIYRLNIDETYEDDRIQSSSMHFPAAKILRTNNPGIEKLSQIHGSSVSQITIPAKGNEAPKHFKENLQAGFVEPEFFEIFSFSGNPASLKAALQEPNNVILTQELARKYFGGDDAIGKVIRFNNKINLKVAAIIPDLPQNTDFPFGLFISYPTLSIYEPRYTDSNWSTITTSQNLYLLSPEGADIPALEASINKTILPHVPESSRPYEKFVLQPLSDLHYSSIYGTYLGRNISMKLIWAMIAVGIFVLLTACINFINLATAQSAKRSKEVGIRKVLGSNRRQLLAQYLGETFLITLAAALLAIIFTELTLPYLNKVMNLKLSFSMLQNPELLLFFVLLILLVTLLAGLYPAFILARFQPINALKNSLTSKQTGGLSLRRALVLIQFTICQLFIICTLVVQQQMKYIREKELGFDKNGVVLLPIFDAPADKLMPYRQEFLKNPAIRNVSFALSAPASGIIITQTFKFNNSPKDAPFQANTKFTDEHYFDLFNIKLLAGRVYTKSDSSNQFVINSTMARKLGMQRPEEAIGKAMALGEYFKGRIVGVTEDYIQSSLRSEVSPSVMVNNKNNCMYMAAKIDLAQTEKALKHLERVWYKAYPDVVFDYQFLDEEIESFYETEQRQSIIFRTLAGISIFIGCLGLYGLVAFMATQRIKEVGIRKVLGASLLDITFLFSKEFIKLVLLAFLIAAPLAYYFMSDWLNDFTYRISMPPFTFLLAGIITLTIALLTMSIQAVRAARRNPVLALKTE